MSFEKLEIEELFKYISEIKDETLTQIIVSDELEIIDLLIHLSSEFSNNNQSLSHYFDEINSDMVAILLNAVTGNYRLSICGLRGILELLCHAFYYDDHMVEYRMFDTENEQATRYVSTLINEQDFFKAKYIKALQSTSKYKEIKANIFSEYMKKEYRDLCNYVHGRGDSFMKKETDRIEFNKKYYNKFSVKFKNIFSIMIVMYEIKFPGDMLVEKYINKNKLINTLIK